MPPAAEAVLTFLQSVGRRSESELYLRLFQTLPKESFAVLALGAPVVRQSLPFLLEHLKFLAELGLYAPIVVGLLDPESAQSSTERLQKRLPAAGLETRAFDISQPGVFDAIRAELQRERFPIAYFKPVADETAVDRVCQLGQLASSLETRKLVLLRRRGALGPQREQRLELGPGHVLQTRQGGISIISLRTDRDALLAKRVLPKRDAQLLEYVNELLTRCARPSLLVSVTSPLDLLRELFTVKGAGTLIKMGTAIQRKADYAAVDLERLSRLLESSFGKTLRRDFFERAPLAIYLEQDYRGAAILEPSPVAPYLAKFAVDPVAQGEGMGQDLWQAMARDYSAMFWRTRTTNPISNWYASIADGFLRLDRWHVFWRGLTPDKVPQVVAEALRRPDDFLE
jgi:acetylglutamate kinase